MSSRSDVATATHHQPAAGAGPAAPPARATLGRQRVVIVGQNPTDPKAWSGAPRRICQAFERAGLLHGTISTINYPARWVRGLARLAGHVNYPGGVHVYRGNPLRRLRARAMRRVFPESGATHVLHMPDGFHLPLYRPDRSVRHFYYFDMTFRSTGIRDIFRRWGVSERMLRDLEKFEAEAYHQMDHCFTQGRHVRDTLVNEYGVDPARVTAVAGGSGQMEPYHGPKDYTKGLILFVAKERIEDKGAALLVDAFKIARRRMPYLRLVMVGESRLPDLVRGVEGAEAYTFIPKEQLVGYFRDSTLFAMPADREVWGQVYLEALAHRTPIVGLKVNAFPELSGDGRYGFIVPEATAESLAATLLSACQQPDLLAQMGSEGQRHVADYFTWDATIKRLTDVMFAT
jgi:glycosyltransferase involved in cell wall biosynthesis